MKSLTSVLWLVGSKVKGKEFVRPFEIDSANRLRIVRVDSSQNLRILTLDKTLKGKSL